jgi:hypothetical protein
MDMNVWIAVIGNELHVDAPHDFDIYNGCIRQGDMNMDMDMDMDRIWISTRPQAYILKCLIHDFDIITTAFDGTI